MTERRGEASSAPGTDGALRAASRRSAASNPFATRFVKPGALAFEYPPGVSAHSLIARLADLGWCGALVGPHGSGKSTLLAELLAQLRLQGHQVTACSLHDGQRRLGRLRSAAPAHESTAATRVPLLVVDGYEQLSWLSRLLLQWRCRGRAMGLLVTAHRPTNLPTLFETRPTAELAARLTGHLLRGEAPSGWTLAAERSFAAHGGNIREVLFELYDLYESQRAERL